MTALGKLRVVGHTIRHRMRIWSLRDLVVRCECGGWSMCSPTFDGESSETLHRQAVSAFRAHVGRSRRFDRRSAKWVQSVVSR